jgi:DNA segregation ATPase FtsK/SpoIIIE, S-DNA-T family
VPVKTKPRPARRTTSYRPRQTHGRRRPARRPAHPTRAVQNPWQLWLGLGAAVAVTAGAFLLADYIVAGIEAVLSFFGLAVLLVLIAVAADIRLALTRPQFDDRMLRWWGGAHLLLLFAIGCAGFWKPDWHLGDVYFNEVTAGGDFGQALTGSLFGLAVWIMAGLSAAALLWPGGARLAGQATLTLGKQFANLDLHRTIWQGVQSFLAGFLPKSEEDNEKLLDKPYVAQYDEDWLETEPEEPCPPEETPAPVEEEEGDGIVVTAEPDEELESYQRELPMGRPAGRGWELPPLDLLAEAAEVEVRPLDNEARSQLIVETLASFGVDARVASINQGPTVTQFGVEPGWETKTRTVAVRDDRGRQVYDRDGRPQTRTETVSRTRVRVNRITSLANDLALALAAPTIRIEAPVPGKPIIGIEVPNTTTSLVAIRSVVESTAFQKANARSKLAIALGKGVSGEPVAADLGKMPHLLIAGATGSGKSVCINSIIACFLLHNTPEELRLVLIDPKRVELANFAQIPHLAFSKIITDTEEVVGTLQAIIHEMDSRYRRFASVGVRNIEAYNKSPRASHPLPQWVVVIDELADLMMAAPYEVERQICRLAQLARATGIHLIIATQRPSVDVVTGLIKANFPTRIAFAVSSQVDSRTIIDGAGAEKLLGRGDMLFMPTDASKPKRLQGSFVSDRELDAIVTWWSSDRFRHLVPDKMDHLLEEAQEEAGEAQTASAEDDPLYEAARELAGQHSRVSTSMLQRRLHIGYPRAARLIDMLEENGVVSGAEGGQSREVLDSSWEEEEDRLE